MAGGKGVDSGWDWLDIQGTLDISATFDILITSLTNPGNVSGLADGFDTTGLCLPGSVCLLHHCHCNGWSHWF